MCWCGVHDTGSILVEVVVSVEPTPNSEWSLSCTEPNQTLVIFTAGFFRLFLARWYTVSPMGNICDTSALCKGTLNAQKQSQQITNPRAEYINH